MTDIGRKAVDEAYSKSESIKANVDCAIYSVPVFTGLYEKLKGNKLPSKAVLIDTVREFEIDEENSEQAVDIFLENLQSVGLLQTLSGAERIVSVEHLIEKSPNSSITTDSATLKEIGFATFDGYYVPFQKI